MMARVNFFGKMAPSISVILKIIELKEKESGNGLMAMFMKGILKMGNAMALV